MIPIVKEIKGRFVGPSEDRFLIGVVEKLHQEIGHPFIHIAGEYFYSGSPLSVVTNRIGNSIQRDLEERTK